MRVLIIDGHPDGEGFASALAGAYADGARNAGHEVRVVVVRDLEFDPILHNGYRTIQPLEPALVESQQSISWAEHVALVYPMWWGQMPALLKGFLDRTFLPGWAFKYHQNDPLWDRLLAGRTATLLVTSDAPHIYNWLVYRNGPVNVARKMVLEFCGLKPVYVHTPGRIRHLNETQRRELIARAEKWGARCR